MTAPVATGTATLSSVNEDTASPAGSTVSTLFGSHFSDVDGDSLAGVAITGSATAGEGVWQYFNGAWVSISPFSVGEGSAIVLAVGTLVRFLPAANFNGTVPALTAYLIDNSGGAVTTGSLIDVSVNGGSTRFSDTSINLTSSITAVNDTPVVPASATTVGATEQTSALLLGALTISDVELDAQNSGNGDYTGASFSVQRASANAADTFSFATGGLFSVSGANLQVGGLTFATFTSTGGVLTVSFTSSGDTATTTLVGDVINHISYTNSSDAPPSSVTLNYSFNDGAPGNGQGTGGTASAGGSVIVNITAVNDIHTGGVSVNGTAAEDQVLTANISTLADADGLGTVHYQWQRDVGAGFTNVGADQSTYTLGDSDIGGVVQVVAYYTDTGGTVESATSTAAGTVVATNDAPTGSVTITGAATENTTLTAVTTTLADSDGLGTLHYQWQRSSGSTYVNIGADQATYALGDADFGATVRVVVSYTDGQGWSNSVTSDVTAAVGGVNDVHTGVVSLTGVAEDDQLMTATSSLADADGLGALHYQWQRGVGSTFVNIGAPDLATYTLTDADVGSSIRVVASYTDGQGFAETETSGASAIITDVNDLPTEISLSAATIVENTSAGTIVGLLSGVDADAGDVLTFSLTSNPGNVFAVNSLGQIVLAAGQSIDFETKSFYAVSVMATDTSGGAFTESFNIAVTDVKENPKGDNGKDVLEGDALDNIINGKGGNDRLTGGDGADIFVFGRGYGRDVITDFDPLEGDVIDLTGAAGIKNFKDLIKHHVEDTGKHIQITTDDGSVLVLKGVDLADLSRDSFAF